MEINNNVAEATKPTTEHFAMEILKQQSDESRAEIRGRNAGMQGDINNGTEGKN